MIDKAPVRGSVFISYSRKDKVWKDRLVQHLAPLRQRGLLEVWDDSRILPGEPWKAQIDQVIGEATVALLLVSPDSLASAWIQDIEAPQLVERAQRGEMRLIPIIVRPCSWQHVHWLSSLQVWPLNGKPLSSLRAQARDASLSDLARQILQLVGTTEAAGPTAPRISISRLSFSSGALFGREAELKVLDDAWENPQIRLVSIMGPGGIGKTALAGHWLSRMAQDRFRGAEQVFAWSFSEYPDGEEFFAEALLSFGEPQAGSRSAEARADRLVQRIQESRTLLILDDVEAFKLPAKDYLLRRLSSGHRGLVVRISRLTLAKNSDSQRVLRLGGLPPETGAALLRSLGVHGTEQDLADACRELEGHPLTLALLGSTLRQSHGGDVRQLRNLIGRDAAVHYADAIQRMLGGSEKSLPPDHLALLRVHALFERPATREEIATVFSPPIPGLTDVPGLESEQERAAALAELAELGLLSVAGGGAASTSHVHPLLREYFRHRLREERPEAFRQGHERLFRYLGSTVSGQPETLEAMAPLISAVAHGCAAGLHAEALRLYRDRIAHGDEQHLTRKFGVPETDLQVLAPFFENPWDRPKSDVGEDETVLLLRAAGVALLDAGRPREALVPTAALLERARASARSADLIWAAWRQSEIQLYLGRLGQALLDAQSAVELAEQSGSADRIAAPRITLADALHQMGRFQEAESAARDFDLPSHRSFDLLLSLGRHQLVLERASARRSLAERSGFLPQVGLFHLTLGRAYQLEKDLDSAQAHLDQAVQILLRGGCRHRLPAALIARAALFIHRGRLDEARTDLDQALEIATRGELRLQEADAWLGFTDLHLTANDPERARQSLSRSRDLVKETGYHRRDRELQVLEERLSAVAAESPLDPAALVFRLVLAGQEHPDLLLHPDAGKIEEAARRLSEDAGDPLLDAQHILEDLQAGIAPNPLWASWIAVIRAEVFQKLGKPAS